MTAETKSGLEYSPRENDLVKEIRDRLLDEHAEFYAGHEGFDRKNDKWVLERDGLLRTAALECDAHGESYNNRVNEAVQRGEEVDHEAFGEHPDQDFSLHRYVQTYSQIRQKHEEMFIDHPEETKIPAINRPLARRFLRELVASGKLVMANGFDMEDISKQDMEDEPMFRFSVSEYHRNREEMAEDKDAFKRLAFDVARKAKKQKSAVTGNLADAWVKPSDVVLVFEGIKANSEYALDGGMYLSESSAEALIREWGAHDVWDEIEGGEDMTSKEKYYRQRPLKD